MTLKAGHRAQYHSCLNAGAEPLPRVLFLGDGRITYEDKILPLIHGLFTIAFLAENQLFLSFRNKKRRPANEAPDAFARASTHRNRERIHKDEAASAVRHALFAWSKSTSR